MVFSVLMKVKSNIKPQNEQNLFSIGGRWQGMPFFISHLMVIETLEDVLSLWLLSSVWGNVLQAKMMAPLF